MRGNSYRGGRGSDGRDSGGRGRGGRDSGGRNGGGGRDRGGRYGGRDSNGRNSGGRGRGGSHRGGRGGSGRGYRSGGTAESGNERERIQVESGALVLIDQFMLANPQVLDALRGLLDDAPEAKDQVVKNYGGTVVNLEPDTYRIARDPYASTIIIHPDGEVVDAKSVQSNSDAKEMGHVYVDTRCLAMVDRELLDDIALLEKYQQLWVTGQDKACRDLLRDNGGAVRYGFERFGDELSVHFDKNDNIVALWPDVIEAEMNSSEEVSSAQAES